MLYSHQVHHILRGTWSAKADDPVNTKYEDMTPQGLNPARAGNHGVG
jgi:hypothetical protein